MPCMCVHTALQQFTSAFFYTLPDIRPATALFPPPSAAPPTSPLPQRNCTFKHQRDKGFTLEIPEFSVKQGELVAVVGRVGAGKSSLLSAILGNMDLISGDSNAGGKISYVPQNAWCQALSVRENIMFGLPVDEEWYRQVIHDCALELDLQILPKGDLSPAGLRGINLSGGQRQRVNLARAAYFNGDLMLLDNALSAVDHHTAQHIFDNLLKSSLREKAIILITHQVRGPCWGWAGCVL